MTMRIHGDKIEFPDGTEQFTASTGSGGGVEAQPPVAFDFVAMIFLYLILFQSELC